MSQSLSCVLIHLVFSTKHRQPLITPEIEPELYAYMGGIFRELKCPMLAGNGTEDHVHLPRFLVDAGLAPSTSEGRRLIEQGAVKLDGEAVGELDLPRERLNQAVLQVGKRRFVRLT